MIATTLPTSLLWQAELPAPVAQHPVVTDKVLIVLTTAALVGLDIKTGIILWQHSTVRRLGRFPIAISGDRVVYGDSQSYVTVLDIDSGQVKWHTKIGGADSTFITSLEVQGGVVFALAQPTNIEARDLKTGELLWKLNGLPAGIDTRGAFLRFHQDKLYVLTNEVHVLAPKTGKIQAVVKQDVWGVIHNNKLYGPTAVYELAHFTLLYKLIPSSQKVLYGDCQQYRTPYTFGDEFMYGVGYCGGIFAIRDNGVIAWVYHADLDGEAPMALLKNNLYALFSNGEIHALNALTGENQGILKTNLPLPGFVTSGDFDARGLTTNGSILIATFNDTTIWAFAAPVS